MQQWAVYITIEYDDCVQRRFRLSNTTANWLRYVKHKSMCFGDFKHCRTLASQRYFVMKFLIIHVHQNRWIHFCESQTTDKCTQETTYTRPLVYRFLFCSARFAMIVRNHLYLRTFMWQSPMRHTFVYRNENEMWINSQYNQSCDISYIVCLWLEWAFAHEKNHSISI